MSRNSRTALDITSIVLYIIISIILLLFAVDYFQIDFKKDVSFETAINLCLAIFVAIVLPITLGQQLENKKNSRELLVSCCIQIQNEIEGILRIVKAVNNNNNLADDRDEIYYIITLLGHLTSSLKDNLKDELKSFKTERIMEEFLSFREIQEDLIQSDFTFNLNYRTKVVKASLQFRRFIEKTKFDINGW